MLHRCGHSALLIVLVDEAEAERDRLKAALEIIDNRYYLPDNDSDILRDALGKLRRAALSGEEGTKP